MTPSEAMLLMNRLLGSHCAETNLDDMLAETEMISDTEIVLEMEDGSEFVLSIRAT